AGERLQAARFMLAMRSRRFRIGQDTTVSRLLALHRQSDRICRRLWHPICVSALNTGPDQASAQTFLYVLRDSLDGRRADSDLLLPAMDFSALFPERAARFIGQHGGRVVLQATVDAVTATAGGFVLQPS